MRVGHRSGWLVVGLAACALAGKAQAEGLAVEPGLWEMTATSGGLPANAVPQIPADKLAKLSPEQQAMIQKRMAAAGSPHTTTHKACVTQAMLDKGLRGGEDEQKHCTRTPVTTSATVVEFKLVCTGDHPANGTFHIEAPDPHTLLTTMEMQVTPKPGMTIPLHSSMQGHWLGADCGDVKPAPGG